MPPLFRTDRTLETREEEARTEVWKEASRLPDPNQHPDFVHRWVRVANRNEPDAFNLSNRTRLGWESCSPSDYPELGLEGTNESTTGHIEMAGHRLCRMTRSKAKLGQEFYQKKTDSQLRGVNMQLESGDNGKVNLHNDSRSRVQRGQIGFGQGE